MKKMKKVEVGSLSWLIYNLLRDGVPRTASELVSDIHKVFSVWSRQFIDRKLNDGIAAGYLKRFKDVPGPYLYTVLEGEVVVTPSLTDVDPEVFFYLKDVASLRLLLDDKYSGSIINPVYEDGSDKTTVMVSEVSKIMRDMRAVMIKTMILKLEAVNGRKVHRMSKK